MQLAVLWIVGSLGISVPSVACAVTSVDCTLRACQQGGDGSIEGNSATNAITSEMKTSLTRQSSGGALAAGLVKDVELARQPQVLRYLALTGEPALRQLLPRGTVAEPFAYEAEWLTGPNGLPVLRFSSHPRNQRLISWFLHFEPQEEVFARYCILIEDDVADGMTERGVKLPGLAGDEVSWRMEHGPVSPASRGLYAALDYIYAADSGRGYGQIRSMNSVFKAGLWYVIEQYVKLNTPGKPDGVGKVWINGILAWESDTVRYRNQATSRMNHVHVNVYHGGMGLPKAPIHYRIAGIAVAKAYIGPPPELIGVIAPEPMLPRTGRASDRPPR